MTGKNIIFYLLAAFITGTLVLIYIQYNSSKNINALTNGNKDYTNEYVINSELRDLEGNVIRIESNVSDFVSTGNVKFLEDLDAKINQARTDLDKLQTINDDETTIALIDSLDLAVHSKIEFCKQLLDTLHQKGKKAAEDLLNTLQGKMLMDAVYGYASQIKDARHRQIEKLNSRNIDSGNRAERLNSILIVLTLLSAALLFWYIITIIQKLVQSEKKIKESARIKENFMANMSHEIRTPMNAILGFTTLLERRDLDEKSREYVRTIQTSGENLLAIINDILDLSKIKAGMMRIESAPFSIRALIHSVEVMFSSKAAEKNLQLEAQVDESIPEILEGDATRLTQILVNLIGNALKFTKEGKITVQITDNGWEGKLLQTGISVTDTGLGIEKSKQQEIFNRFQQADDSVTRNFGGTGLGLSIVQELVLLQNGTIHVDSEPGKGTTFSLVIAYAIPGKPGEIKMDLAGVRNGGKADFSNKHILVAEDNEINQSLVKHLFSEWKLRYDLVQNGREAIDMLKQKKYDLVLMDIQMPEMDGYSAAKEIRETLQLKTPIIAMTAHALAGEREKCLGYGMNEYISKPIREAQLHALIAQFTNTPVTDEVKARPPQSTIRYAYINLDYMQEVSGGNLDYEKEVTAQFIEAVPEALTAIESAWRNNNIDDLRQEAHNMKTTMSVMRLTEILQPTLEMLEYGELTPALFAEHFASLREICTGALGEAKEFYSSLN